VKRPRGRPRKVPVNPAAPAPPSNLLAALPAVLSLSDDLKANPVALGLVGQGSALQGDVNAVIVPAVAVVLEPGAQFVVNKPSTRHTAPIVPPVIVPVIAAVSEVAAARATRFEHGARQSARLSPPSSTTAAGPVVPNSNSSSGASKSDVSYKSVMSRRRQNA